jgi:hypothetical protein
LDPTGSLGQHTGELGAVDAHAFDEVEHEHAGLEHGQQPGEGAGVGVEERRERVQLIDRRCDGVEQLVAERSIPVRHEHARPSCSFQPGEPALQVDPALAYAVVVDPQHEIVDPVAPAADRRQAILVIGLELAEQLVALL